MNIVKAYIKLGSIRKVSKTLEIPIMIVKT